MKRLIDKDALVAEIERRKQTWQHQDQQYVNGGKDVCDYLLGFLDTLEVKEVDLDAELEHYKAEQNIKYEEDINMFEFAKHFFELSLKARINKKTCEGYYVPWLTPDQARKAVEIAREEELEYIKYQLDLRLPETLDYNGVQVDREDFINDFVKAMKDE